MISDVLEAAHLIILSRQIEQRVVDEKDQRVGVLDRDVREIAYRYRNPVTARFAAQLGDHLG
jgi:hypothetical protein